MDRSKNSCDSVTFTNIVLKVGAVVVESHPECTLKTLTEHLMSFKSLQCIMGEKLSSNK